MSNCAPHLLVEREAFYIAQCKSCKRIGLHYKNLLAEFHLKDFELCSQQLLDVDFSASAVLFPDRKRRVVIRSCHQCIDFTFTHHEFKEMKDALSQALLVLKAEKLIHEAGA